jgi:hypothetical protein
MVVGVRRGRPDQPPAPADPRRARARRLGRTAVAGVVLAVGVAWWAGTDRGDRPGPDQPGGATGQPAVAADIDQIAAAVGCQARVTGENSGYRQAVCVTSGGRYTITTFATGQGQQDWLADALPYGGAYLVGRQWVVGGNTADGLPAFATRLGGTIVDRTEAHHS